MASILFCGGPDRRQSEGACECLAEGTKGGQWIVKGRFAVTTESTNENQRRYGITMPIKVPYAGSSGWNVPIKA